MSEKNTNDTNTDPTNDSPQLSKESTLDPQEWLKESGASKRILEQVLESLREGNREDEEMRKEYGLK